ncbi:MFS transporter [Levilactobacillus bambusae]|uniref:MFS transporter n=1 Tax=Levilactobacillus bambusae TaxID=2024736 RepID=A0A2V1N0Q6_9LACO|nr:MFS transporter [Levilactobacillus bambusae]PWG00328.1 MFS transporter [Levilactobacillus bambusae]
MTSLLLIFIYLAFVSLGLPDSLLGSAWPAMHQSLNVPLASAGLITMIISIGTILSSLFANRLIRKRGTAAVTTWSVFLTALALLGFALSPTFWGLCLLAIPYGLGAGAIDTALNNFVALHFSSRHMNWLHCMWGVGATLSPILMGTSLRNGFGWRGGYLLVAGIQAIIWIALIISLPLWHRFAEVTPTDAEPLITDREPLWHIKGFKAATLSFFVYNALEQTTGLWTSSFLVKGRAISVASAAQYTAFFYMGIMTGRFFAGVLANRVSDRRLIQTGLGCLALGTLLLLIPTSGTAILALPLMGLGCAPIYPSLIHETPTTFGPARSQAMIGYQMASAYTGTTLLPPLFGWLTQTIGIQLFPLLLAGLVLILTSAIYRIHHL